LEAKSKDNITFFYAKYIMMQNAAKGQEEEEEEEENCSLGIQPKKEKHKTSRFLLVGTKKEHQHLLSISS
jgi:hypothetical protein